MEKIKIKIDEELRELIPGYLENRRTDVTKIIDFLSQSKFEEISRIGHSMKGTGGSYGFEIISEIGKIIEQYGKENNISEIKKANETLKKFLDAVEIL